MERDDADDFVGAIMAEGRPISDDDDFYMHEATTATLLGEWRCGVTPPRGAALLCYEYCIFGIVWFGAAHLTRAPPLTLDQLIDK